MALVFVYLFASLIVFFILTELITLDIYYDEVLTVNINFMVFALRLSKKQSNVSGGRGKSFRPPINALKSFITRLLKVSFLYVKKLHVFISAKTPFSYAISHGAYSSFISTCLIFAEQACKKFAYDNILVAQSDHTKSKICFNIKIEFTLYSLLICLFLLILNSFIKRDKINGGKQNERYNKSIT